MEFTDVVARRYACKKYDGRPVDPAALQAILEAGRLAPTAKNLQEQKIYVVQSPEGLAKIDALTPCRYGAPTVLLVAFDSENVYQYPGGGPRFRHRGCGHRGHPHDAGRLQRRCRQLLAQPL